MEGLQASSFGTASEVSPGELSVHRHLPTHISRTVPQSTPPGSHGDTLACLFRNEMDPRCTQKEVRPALIVGAMRVRCLATANLSRRRSVLRPTIFAPRPRCRRGGFSTHCYLRASFSRIHAELFPPGSRGDTPHRTLVLK